MSRSRVSTLVMLLAALAVAPPARADLDGDVERVARAFGSSGEVTRLTPRLLERGSLRPLLLPRAAVDPTSDDCTTVVVLGAVSTSFLLRFLPARGVLVWPEGERPETSIAGAGQLVRCGVRKAMLERLAVEMRSPRGVIEVLVARGPRPFPPLLRSLTERDPGPIAPLGSSGPRPSTPPLTDRLRRLEARVTREGSAPLVTRWYRAAASGGGQVRLPLTAGCHRIDLLGAPSEEPDAPVDIDADLVTAEGDVLATDHTESSDATLETCIGQPSTLELRFMGALPGLPIVLSVAQFPLPAGLPASWPSTWRARMAEALRQQRGPGVFDAPVYTSLGVSGVTLLPIELQPSSCYVAAVAAVSGDTTGIALSAEIGPHQAQNRSAPGKTGTIVAFCARGVSHALLDVEARGSGMGFLFALWRTGSIPLGEVAE